ncbi:hypothetical protein DERP_011357 [Dermatophagoides pteronyssinus]|uniref:Transposase n=1 Tax=Dermatophagoides pteronyssinus TaxID=6956 RepID=A0ABQ8J7Y6_DERPT|nr:hypothetical protein DERP_011357 [Dermatophagoides pteronyssinus]
MKRDSDPLKFDHTYEKLLGLTNEKFEVQITYWIRIKCEEKKIQAPASYNKMFALSIRLLYGKNDILK